MLTRTLRIALAACAACALSSPALAQAVPHSLVASPDIYKVIADGPQFRVIQVTWAAGQRDVQHSHPASAVYYPMNCTLRQFGADGAAGGQRDVPAGSAYVQSPIASHSVQNVGAQPCTVIMFEPK